MDPLTHELMGTFLEELEEHVVSLKRDLLAVERETDADRTRELIVTLFRTAHSLKGASRSIGLGEIEAACHRMEDIMAAVRDGRSALTQEMFGLFFALA